MEALCAGIDMGGTSGRLHAASPNGRHRMRRSAAGANLRRDGPGRTLERLEHLLFYLPAATPLRALVVGLAGGGERRLLEAMQRMLSERLPGTRVRVTDDAEIAFEAAFGNGSGLLLIAGTGSICLLRDRKGRRRRAGGWGSLLGDDGSGTTIGRAAWRAVAADLDGGPSTQLTHRIGGAQCRSIEELLSRLYDEPPLFAATAPTVLEVARGGDPVAEGIVREQAAMLARQAGWLTASVPDAQREIVIAGGLSKASYYVTQLREELHQHCAGWSIRTLRRAPAEGALAAARRLATGSTRGVSR